MTCFSISQGIPAMPTVTPHASSIRRECGSSLTTGGRSQPKRGSRLSFPISSDARVYLKVQLPMFRNVVLGVALKRVMSKLFSVGSNSCMGGSGSKR
jgi:hypothetical protein